MCSWWTLRNGNISHCSFASSWCFWWNDRCTEKEKFSFLTSLDRVSLKSELISNKFRNTTVPEFHPSLLINVPTPLAKRLSNNLKHFSEPMVIKTQGSLAQVVLLLVLIKGAERSLSSSKKSSLKLEIVFTTMYKRLYHLRKLCYALELRANQNSNQILQTKQNI